jgi:DNA-binding NtrC family response regulator
MSISKYRTIIIDDDNSVRELLVLTASLRKHEVFSFASPIDCALSQDTPCSCEPGYACCDVLITDHMMPDMTGLEFLEILEKKKCLIPNKALVTAAQSNSVMGKAKSLGCTLFRKPFQISQICSWLEKCERNVKEDRILKSKGVALFC